MPNKSYLIIALVVVIVAIAGGVYLTRHKTIEPIACTEEAKLCPDGSAVGRTGPNCEFAPCPKGDNSSSAEASIGETIYIQGLSITPLGVLSDSRCPTDARCIWAGEIKIKAQISDDIETVEKEMTLDKAVTFGDLTVTLKNVLPAPISKQTILPADYKFEFAVTSTIGVANDSTKGLVTGKVLLGPTCPVERIPPDPNCADKPYQTTVQVIAIGSPKSSAFAIAKTDKEGNYQIELPPGIYALQPVGGSVLPRCETKEITVKAGVSQVINLSCDSGIR